jgi:L-threonylcarbamoyladenylate synthase
MKTILFVCSGNTCRSPMAEAIARHWIERGVLGRDADVFVASAGGDASDGQPPAQQAIRALRNLGLEHDGASKPLTAAMIRKADLVFGMTEDHIRSARQLVADSPSDQEKIVRLDPRADIQDPIGSGQAAYDELADRFMTLIPQRLKEMLGHANRARLGPSRR